MNHLRHAIIVKTTAIKRHSTRSSYMNFTESFKPIRLFVEVCTITTKRHSLITQPNITLCNLHIWHQHLVVSKVISMVYIELTTLLFRHFLSHRRVVIA